MADDWFRREAREQRVLARVRERLVVDRTQRERSSGVSPIPRFEGLSAEREARYTRLVEAEGDDAGHAPAA